MTPVDVTPPIGTEDGPGTVTCSDSIADPPTSVPSTNDACGWNASSAIISSAQRSSWSREAGGFG